MALASFSHMQPTWFKVLHSDDAWLTCATHARRHAGGVAMACLANKARMAAEEKVNAFIVVVDVDDK